MKITAYLVFLIHIFKKNSNFILKKKNNSKTFYDFIAQRKRLLAFLRPYIIHSTRSPSWTSPFPFIAFLRESLANFQRRVRAIKALFAFENHFPYGGCGVKTPNVR